MFDQNQRSDFNRSHTMSSKKTAAWTRDELLNQKGIFLLDDVAAVLPVNVNQLTREANKLQRQGGSPWHELGLRKVWNQWVVRMHVFRKYYARQYS